MIKKMDSIKYDKFYSPKYLLDIQQDGIYVIVSAIKGIGKTYGTFNDIVIEDINNGNFFIYIRETHNEVKQFIEETEIDGFWDNLNFDYKFKTSKKITRLLKINKKNKTKEVIGLLFPISASKIIKGMGIKSFKNTKFTIVFDEFLNDNGIYIKPREMIHTLMSAIGSIVRHNKFKFFFIGNLNNKDNPYAKYLFSKTPWANNGELIYNDETKTLIDAPLISDYVKNIYKNNNSTFLAVTKNNDEIHDAFFGGKQMRYVNSDFIIQSYNENKKRIMGLQLEKTKVEVYEIENGKKLWITRNIDESKSFYGLSQDITKLNNVELANSHMIRYVDNYLVRQNCRFSDGEVALDLINSINKTKFIPIDLSS